MSELIHSSTLSRKAPPWASISVSKLPPEAFAQLGPDPLTWQFPHHWVADGRDPDGDGRFELGELYLHYEALEQMWQFATGWWNGIPLGSLDVIAHLRRHFADVGVTAARLQQITRERVEVLDARLVAAGLLTEADLTPTIQARVRSFAR